jgi:hypothetical protein
VLASDAQITAMTVFKDSARVQHSGMWAHHQVALLATAKRPTSDRLVVHGNEKVTVRFRKRAPVQECFSHV